MAEDSNEVHVSIGGNVSGQVAAGRDITQVMGAQPLSAEEVQQLKLALAALRRDLTTVVPLEQQEAALEQTEKIKDAVLAPKLDVSAIARARDWFVDHIPDAAGAVASFALSPIVGRLVQAAGDAAVAEFKERFGPTAGEAG